MKKLLFLMLCSWSFVSAQTWLQRAKDMMSFNFTHDRLVEEERSWAEKAPCLEVVKQAEQLYDELAKEYHTEIQWVINASYATDQQTAEAEQQKLYDHLEQLPKAKGHSIDYLDDLRKVRQKLLRFRDYLDTLERIARYQLTSKEYQKDAAMLGIQTALLRQEYMYVRAHAPKLKEKIDSLQRVLEPLENFIDNLDSTLPMDANFPPYEVIYPRISAQLAQQLENIRWRTLSPSPSRLAEFRKKQAKIRHSFGVGANINVGFGFHINLRKPEEFFYRDEQIIHQKYQQSIAQAQDYLDCPIFRKLGENHKKAEQEKDRKESMAQQLRKMSEAKVKLLLPVSEEDFRPRGESADESAGQRSQPKNPQQASANERPKDDPASSQDEEAQESPEISKEQLDFILNLKKYANISGSLSSLDEKGFAEHQKEFKNQCKKYHLAVHPDRKKDDELLLEAFGFATQNPPYAVKLQWDKESIEKEVVNKLTERKRKFEIACDLIKEMNPKKRASYDDWERKRKPAITRDLNQTIEERRIDNEKRLRARVDKKERLLKQHWLYHTSGLDYSEAKRKIDKIVNKEKEDIEKVIKKNQEVLAFEERLDREEKYKQHLNECIERNFNNRLLLTWRPAWHGKQAQQLKSAQQVRDAQSSHAQDVPQPPSTSLQESSSSDDNSGAPPVQSNNHVSPHRVTSSPSRVRMGMSSLHQAQAQSPMQLLKMQYEQENQKELPTRNAPSVLEDEAQEGELAEPENAEHAPQETTPVIVHLPSLTGTPISTHDESERQAVLRTTPALQQPPSPSLMNQIGYDK